MQYSDLLKKVVEFRNARDWKQFHTPENLAISVTIEAAELLENFQWQEHPKNVDNLKEEAADVMIYLMLLSEELGFDLIDAVDKKIDANNRKYPVDKAKGNSKKYSEFD